MFWLLLLPFRLVFGLLFGILLLPFFLLRAAVKVAAVLILFPVVFALLLVALIVGGIGFWLVMLVPVLPLAVLALFIWTISRLFARPALI
ncbi:MAG: hypothetical protein ABW292_17625 [Vicinamibacterales bacterium]